MANVSAELKKNEMLAQRLCSALSRIPRKTLGVYAATALDIAVKATKIDSARAAANWNLSFGSYSPDSSWNPAAYEGSVNGMGTIGKRGDRQAGIEHRERILGYKAYYYGYDKEASYKVPIKGGYIDRMLRISETSSGFGRLLSLFQTSPVVTLYNPITSNEKYMINAGIRAAEDIADETNAAASVAFNSILREAEIWAKTGS